MTRNEKGERERKRGSVLGTHKHTLLPESMDIVCSTALTPRREREREEEEEEEEEGLLRDTHTTLFAVQLSL